MPWSRNKKAQRQAGSGLGLFLVAGWIKSLGGEVSWMHQTDPDGRETVTFSLWVLG
jgi:signal transduction histidine kinase